MRFGRLDLIRYGHFTDRTLALPRSEVDLHILVGPNEAGKSTAQAAIDDLLFGFGHKTTRDFVHLSSALRVGALIETKERAVEVRRRKGNRETLLDKDERPIAETTLASILGVERGFFESMFSLGYERLREGGQRILDASDDVGRMIFEAGAGLADVRKLGLALEAEADALFAPRASANRRFYSARARYEEADRQVRAATSPARNWLEAKKALDQLTDRRDKLLADVGKSKAERARLERRRRVLPLLAELRRVEADLAAMGDLPHLPGDAERELNEAERSALTARTRADAVAKTLEGKREQLAGVAFEDRLLAHETEIEQLRDLRTTAAKSRLDIVRRKTEFAQLEERIKHRLAEAGVPAPDLVGIAAILPSRPRVTTIERLLEERGGHLAAERQTADAHAALLGDRDRLKQELDESGEPMDPRPLAREIAAARDRSDFDAEIKQARKEMERVEARLRTRLDLLRPWAGDIEALRALVVPDSAWIDRFQKRLDDAEKADRKLEEELRLVDEQIAETKLRREQLVRGDTAISRESLVSARAAREQGWRLVRARYVEGVAVDADAEGKYAGSRDLPTAFEAAVSEADSVADKRFDRAGDAVLLAESESLAERLALKQALQRKAVEARAGARENLEREWQASWPTEVAAPDPGTMIRWTEVRLEAFELHDQLSLLRGDIARAGSSKEEVRGAVLRAIAAANGDTRALEDAPVATVLREADTLRNRLETERTDRAGSHRQLASVERKLTAAKDAAKRAAEEVATWIEEWGQALAAIGRSVDEKPDAVRAVLEILGEVRTDLKAARDLEVRIGKIQDDISSFERAAAALRHLAPDLVGRPDTDLTNALLERLATAKAEADRGRRLEQEAAICESELQARDLEKRTAEGIIERLQEMARVPDVDGVRGAIEAQRRRASLVLQRESELAKLSQAGDGLPRDELEAKADLVDRDALPAIVNSLAESIESMEQELRSMSADIAKASGEFLAIAGGAAAETAASDRALAAAEMVDAAERYVRLRSSSRLLAWAIDKYRRDRQAPLLQRASALFRVLTRNSFESLTVQLDDQDRASLVGVRASGGPVPVDGMSDGSRDQLYLALRLAAVEAHIARERPLPFIADDLFVNFDDERAAAGFQVLGELARRTQVLFFTHHLHLAEVARGALGQDISVQSM